MRTRPSRNFSRWLIRLHTRHWDGGDLIFTQHQRYGGITLVYIVVLDHESHWFRGDVSGRELAAVIPNERGIVAAGDLASVIHQVHGFPDIAVRLQVILIESIEVA